MATLSDLYTHLKTLCEQWFYNKSTVDTYLNNKVDKETGKGLSTNDYTTAEKTKLSGIEAEANKTTVDSALSSTSTNPLQNKAINTALSSKASQSDLNTLSSTVANKLDASDYVVDSALSSTSENPVQNKAINTALNGKASSDHTHKTMGVTEESELSNIGTSAHATQHDVNTAIDNIIGNLTGAELVTVVTTLPSASSNTMNALYVLFDGGQYDIYITVYDGNSFSWEKLDDDVLSDLSIDWSDIENIPSSFTPASHTHGQITNDGKITSTAVSIASGDNILITDASDSSIVKRVATILSTHMKHSSALANIGTSANATQSTINTSINTALGTINTNLGNKASSTHTHNNITNDGKVTTTGTNGGNLLVTNSSDEVIVESSIDVLDGVVQSLITYGNS